MKKWYNEEYEFEAAETLKILAETRSTVRRSCALTDA